MTAAILYATDQITLHFLYISASSLGVSFTDKTYVYNVVTIGLSVAFLLLGIYLLVQDLRCNTKN